MPLNDEGFEEYSVICAVLDFKDKHGAEKLAAILNLALTQIGLKAVPQ